LLHTEFLIRQTLAGLPV